VASAHHAPSLVRVLEDMGATWTMTSTSPLAEGATYGVENLYEWDEGALRLVSVLPDGTAVPGSLAPIPSTVTPPTPEHQGVVSSDGSHVLFTYGGALYDRISTNGRATTYGILFNAGSDHIRDSSTPTLAGIGDMLKAHPELELTIEGHTDNVGSSAANQKLSDKRAAAVKTYLVNTYAIDAARLKSVGYGATRPISPNTTAEGRQDNRRIELVKTP